MSEERTIFITRTTKATVEVLGPCDMRDGACCAREMYCVCTGFHRAANANLICLLLNRSQKVEDRP